MVTLQTKIAEYKTLAETFLSSKGFTLEQVVSGVDAWAVAHQSGISKDAYAMSRDITDAHIKTVLQKIMPNAIFKDKYRYWKSETSLAMTNYFYVNMTDKFMSGWGEAKTESTFSHHRYGAAAERLARERCEIVNKGLAP